MGVKWQSRKRLTFFGLPWTFTTYKLTDDKFIINSGLFTSSEDEIRLYRIVDISLKRTFLQKIFKLGTISCDTVDKTCPKLDIINVKDSRKVKELISEAVESERIKKRVSSREYMHSIDDDDDDDYDNYH
ncbi:MAG: PH domain-containing protein [Lachnospiraceae bacterium]|nr:PH domain-containing protein [Lachnospiraceae bacterium]